MTGFGIRIHPEVQRQLGPRRLWRPHSFLHQLSMSGAMLWMPNHDRVWLEGLGSEDEWLALRDRLRATPAGRVRQILWSASADWLEQMRAVRPRLEQFVFEQGLEAPAALNALDEELALRAAQLEQLRWCASDTSEEAIELVSK